jgi:choline dehydrogenase-like flavoprotein
MNTDFKNYTFDELAALSGKELDQLMETSEAAKLEEVAGYEYRGWNVNAMTKISGTRKFKTGFFGDPDRGYLRGYNVRIVQDGREWKWQVKKMKNKSVRFAYFNVLPPFTHRKPKYEHEKSLIIDYAKSGAYFFLNPVKYTVDYVVCPNPKNRNLLLGKSNFEAGPLRFFMGYFILERDPQKSNFEEHPLFFSKRELKTVEKFSEILIDGQDAAIDADKIARNIDTQFERMKSKRKRSLKLLLFVIEYLIPLLYFKRPFSKMNVESRKNFIRKFVEIPKQKPGWMKSLLLGWYFRLQETVMISFSRIKPLFLLGYYGDPAVYKDIDFVTPDKRARYAKIDVKILESRNRVVTTLEPANAVDTQEIKADVCVIGSGAGGAVVAYKAAAAGYTVVLLEEGKYVKPEEITHDECEMLAKFYKEGGLPQTTADFGMTILQGKTLGGTTVVNNAICFRLNDEVLNQPKSPDIFKRWRDLGAQIDRNLLTAAYERVERMINVHQIPNDIAGENGHILINGWKKLLEHEQGSEDFKFGLFKKNYDECLGCGYCVFGCAYKRKVSMLESYIPAAIVEGAQIVSDCHAVKIDHKKGKAKAVLCELRNGKQLRVQAKKIVLSCGAIGSSVLLMKSSIRRNVGSRFSFNAGTPVLAKFPKKINSFDGLSMASYLDCDDYILESLFTPPMSFSSTVPGWFETHFQRMKQYAHFASIGVLVGTDHNGRVKKSRFFRDTFGPVKYRMVRNDFEKMKRGICQVAKIYFAAGADTVYAPTFKDLEMPREKFTSGAAIDSFIDENIKRPEDLLLNSSHPQGGNPMSDDRSIGVVDSGFKVHGFENLYVCDASIFPTTISINPQLTIMAMADYFSEMTFSYKSNPAVKVVNIKQEGQASKKLDVIE